MQVNRAQPMKGYVLSLVLSMGLNIFSFPGFLQDLNPDWVLLTLIYWLLAMPERIGVFNAWGVGLLVDVLTGRLLGQHALTYALISYFSLKFHKRLRQYLLPQQSLYIFLCLFFSKIMEFMIENLQGDTEFTLAFWLPVFIGTFCWPVINIALRLIRVFGRIS